MPERKVSPQWAAYPGVGPNRAPANPVTLAAPRLPAPLAQDQLF